VAMLASFSSASASLFPHYRTELRDVMAVASFFPSIKHPGVTTLSIAVLPNSRYVPIYQ
jgi:hypothetical protein